MIGRSNSAVLGAEFVHERTVTGHEVELTSLARQPEWPALGHVDVDGRRQLAAQRGLGEPRRFEQLGARPGQVHGEDVGALEIADDGLDFSVRDADVPVHTNPADPEQTRVIDETHRPVPRERDERERRAVRGSRAS